jgi:hypothetical protein
MKLLKFTVILCCVSTLVGCAFVQGLIGLAGSGTPTTEDAEAVGFGIKAFIGLLSGDYAGALYWGAAACGGSLYAGAKGTKVAGQVTATKVRKIITNRKNKKAALQPKEDTNDIEPQSN